MRGLLLMVLILVGSAALISSMGGSGCDKEVIAEVDHGAFRVITAATDCGGRSKATEVGLAQPERDPLLAEPIFVLPGLGADYVEVVPEGSEILVKFPRGSHMISKATQWQDYQVRFVEGPSLEEAAEDEAPSTP